jgi:hypothetical protein
MLADVLHFRLNEERLQKYNRIHQVIHIIINVSCRSGCVKINTPPSLFSYPSSIGYVCPGSVVVAHWLLTYAARVRSSWSTVVVCERVWLVAHSDTWVFSGCSGFLPQQWPPSAKHPCITQDPIENKLSSFHGLSLVNVCIYIYRIHVCFVLWLKYCQIGVKPYSINQLINRIGIIFILPKI